MTHRFVDHRTRETVSEQRWLSTSAETLPWRDLRGRRCDGFKFRRQVPIGPYIADFVCLEARLVVEWDGRPHEDPAQIDHDARRERWLEAQGFQVLRFSNTSCSRAPAIWC